MRFGCIVSIATVLAGKGGNIDGQRSLIFGSRGKTALRRAMLAKNPADPTFGFALHIGD